MRQAPPEARTPTLDRMLYRGLQSSQQQALRAQTTIIVMNPPLLVPEPLMLLLVAYLAWSLELD